MQPEAQHRPALKSTCIDKARAHGWSADRDDSIVEALTLGFTRDEIAAGLRVSLHTLDAAIARLRLHRRLPPSNRGRA